MPEGVLAVLDSPSLPFVNLNRKYLIWLSILAGLIAYLGWLDFVELRAEEPRRAIVSLEMFFSGNWIFPTVNELPYYNKPPLFNWVMVAFFHLVGHAEEWVVRLPSLLSFFTTCLLVYFLFKRELGKQVALYGALFLFTSADILFFGGVYTGEIDLFYSLLVFIQTMAIFRFHRSNSWWLLFTVSYLFCALGFLTKGLPSLPFQIFSLLAMALASKQWRWLFSVQHAVGMALFALVVVSYFYAYSTQGDVEGFLIRQFDEAASKTGLETKFSDTLIQLVTFPLQFLKLLFPWSLLVVFLFVPNSIKPLRAKPLLAFSVLFILLNIPLYWVSGLFKARYLYMFLPFACIILAQLFLEFREAYPMLKRIVHIVLVILSAILILGFLSPPFLVYTQDFDLVWPISVLGFALSACLFYFLLRSKEKLLVFLLVMILARIGYNFFYLPAFQNDPLAAPYRAISEEILEITGEERILYWETPLMLKTKAAIGPIQFTEKTIPTAKYMAYQVPYYLTRYQGTPLDYVKKMVPGKYHLVVAFHVEGKELDVVYRYYDRARKTEMLIVVP